MEPVKPKRGSPPQGTPLAADGKSVKSLPNVDVQLGKAAKKLQMTKSNFASAAVAYFTKVALTRVKRQRLVLPKLRIA